METREEKIQRVAGEQVRIVGYNAAWPVWFAREKAHLLACMPEGLMARIEQFGSTAVVGLAAKPIVDMVIEVTDVDAAKCRVPEILEPQGYDCFWRLTWGDDVPPWCTWCIKRDTAGRRTHHWHFGPVGFKASELRFCGILRARPEVASAYGALKIGIAAQLGHDRVAYTEAKTEFIRNVMARYG